jgi:hypothetical protein
MLETSVSNLNLYKIWKEQEDLDVGWLLTKILVREQTDKMKAGEAFHKALESTLETDHYSVSAMGYTFQFLVDAEMALPRLREASLSQDYAGLLVKGRVDGITGKLVTDLKTTEQFDAERYVDGLQWRYYLDMTGADRFDWHVFQMSEAKSPGTDVVYEVYGYHKLTQYRYAGMHEDCVKWAREYRDFAERFLPIPEAVSPGS